MFHDVTATAAQVLEEDDVSSGRTVTLGDLTAPDFRFRTLEILTVVKGPGHA